MGDGFLVLASERQSRAELIGGHHPHVGTRGVWGNPENDKLSDWGLIVVE